MESNAREYVQSRDKFPKLHIYMPKVKHDIEYVQLQLKRMADKDVKTKGMATYLVKTYEVCPNDNFNRFVKSLELKYKETPVKGKGLEVFVDADFAGNFDPSDTRIVIQLG